MCYFLPKRVVNLALHFPHENLSMALHWCSRGLHDGCLGRRRIGADYLKIYKSNGLTHEWPLAPWTSQTRRLRCWPDQLEPGSPILLFYRRKLCTWAKWPWAFFFPWALWFFRGRLLHVAIYYSCIIYDDLLYLCPHLIYFINYVHSSEGF